jgi:hypothetical protein
MHHKLAVFAYVIFGKISVQNKAYPIKMKSSLAYVRREHFWNSDFDDVGIGRARRRGVIVENGKETGWTTRTGRGRGTKDQGAGAGGGSWPGAGTVYIGNLERKVCT